MSIPLGTVGEASRQALSETGTNDGTTSNAKGRESRTWQTREGPPDMGPAKRRARPPWGYKWRSSTWYITSVVGVGICSDAMAYQIIIPVLPYRFQSLGYTNVSEKVSWMSFAYSIGIFISTFPIAYYFARFPYRRMPLVVAVLIMEGGQILFMLARPYAALIIARLLMGAASTVIWTVGLALICENVDEARIGRQIGFAISGVSIGTTVAPPVGGALYWHLGWYAPFIFGIIFLAVDLVARLLVLERKQLLKYDLAEQPSTSTPPVTSPIERTTEDVEKARPDPTATELRAGERSLASGARQPRVPTKVRSTLSPWRVIVELAKSSRGMGGIVMTFIFGLCLGALDPTLTLRVQAVWHKNSDFVGLVYLAASVPLFVTGPVIGALADKYGAEWIMAPSLLLTAPWLALLILDKSLPGFVVFFSLSQTLFSCALGPVGLELAMAAREIEGMSEIHQFAAMNLAFAISTAIGAVVGGQVYGNLTKGWDALCWLLFGLTLAWIPLPFCTAGKKTLLDRFLGRRGKLEDQGDLVQVEASRHASNPSEIATAAACPALPSNGVPDAT